MLVTTYKDFPPGWGHIKVPMSSRAAARAALWLYGPSAGRGQWVQRAAVSWVTLFGPRALPGRSFAWHPANHSAWGALAEAWRRELGAFDELAGYERLQETRGGCAVLLLRRGAPLAFLKLRHAGDERMPLEERAARMVWTSRPRAFVTPEPLMSGSAGGWSYLAFAPFPTGGHRPPRQPSLGPVLRDVQSGLASLPRPVGTPPHWVPMHGDLAPWNLRELRAGGLALVDWEGAAWGPPGADEVYYRAAEAALRRYDPPACGSSEAREFWRRRIRAGRGRSRDDRLAAGMHRALAVMTGAALAEATVPW